MVGGARKLEKTTRYAIVLCLSLSPSNSRSLSVDRGGGRKGGGGGALSPCDTRRRIQFVNRALNNGGLLHAGKHVCGQNACFCAFWALTWEFGNANECCGFVAIEIGVICFSRKQ